MNERTKKVSELTLSNNSTLSQSIEIVDPEGSYKKDNQKQVNSKTDLSKYFEIRKQLWFLTHLELRLLKIDIEDHLQKWEGSQ